MFQSWVYRQPWYPRPSVPIAAILTVTSTAADTGDIAITGSGGTVAMSGTSTVTGDIAITGSGGTVAMSETATDTGTIAITGSGGTVAMSGTSTVTGTIAINGSGGSVQMSSAILLDVEAGGRYLVDTSSGNAPFPILGEAAWEASHNLSSTDQATYVADRQAKGFNAYLQEAIDHKFNASKPPKDIDGNLPFNKRLDAGTYTGSPNGTTSASGNAGQYSADNYSNINNESPDFTYPVEAYWTRLDSYISLVGAHGGVVLLYPAYVGFGGGDEGWMQEMVANDAITGAGGFAGQSWADGSKTKMWNYGAWLANRYKSYSNIIWVHGGDYGSGGASGTFTTAEKAAVNNVFAGMLSIGGQLSTLHTAHWSGPASGGTGLSSTTTLSAGTFDLETVYTDTRAAELTHDGYAAGVGPTFEIENPYEDSADAGPNRRLTWWSFLGCIGGAFFGGYSWRFVSGTWDTHLSSQGSLDRQVFHNFVQSIAWYALKPEGLGGMGTIVTAGGGTESPQSTSYVAAAAAADGSRVVAYVPPAHSGDVTIDMTKMSGAARSRWFDPTDGSYTTIGTIAATSTHAYTPPGNNAEGTYDDWVLVLDLAAAITGDVAITGSGGTVAMSGTETVTGTIGITGSGGTVAAAETATVTGDIAITRANGIVEMIGEGASTGGGFSASRWYPDNVRGNTIWYPPFRAPG